MTTDTSSRIIEYITYHGQARVYDLHKTLQLSSVAIHKQLNKLLREGFIIRTGKPPLVLYRFPLETSEPTGDLKLALIPSNTRQAIETNFLSITPDGRLLYGIKGFEYWTHKYQKNKALETAALEYSNTLEEQKSKLSQDGWIDATSKIADTFKDTSITHLLFKDVYSYKIYGRTKLAKLVMHAKQTGERELIDQVSDLVKPFIEKIIQKYAIEAVVYIPPTIPRPLQFMDEMKYRLNLQIPEIKLLKLVPGDIPIPQKTLSSLEERVINARDSIFIKSPSEPLYKNVLLIDDVAGSGASFHETAKKLINSRIGEENIIAFALVGNVKGYDVIRDI